MKLHHLTVGARASAGERTSARDDAPRVNRAELSRLGTYEESAWCARVEVLADGSDSDFERYTLRVIEIIGLAQQDCAPAIGARFEYLRCRGFACAGLARLTLDAAERESSKRYSNPPAASVAICNGSETGFSLA